jgi:PAP2 superfamily
MKRKACLFAGVCAIALQSGQVSAEDGRRPRASLSDTNPLTELGGNVANGFTGWNAALHLTGLAVTPAIIYSGGDTEVHNTLARHQQLEPYSTPGVYIGYALPLAATGGFLAYGLTQDAPREVGAASAVVQAAGIALVYQSTLKAFTGRPPPDPIVYGDNTASRTFRFGLLRGGVHYGWPSGHMMTSTAIVTSLFPLYPDSWGLKLGGGTFLLYMMGSVAMHESSSMHWTSDIVAGTLMGYAIGQGVGAGFAEHLGISKGSEAAFVVTPMAVEGTTGLSVSGVF